MNTPLLLITILVVSETAQGCIDGKVRRLDDGRVNICSSQEWKTVCEKNPDGRWNVRKTNVACRLLGYEDNGATVNRVCSNRTAWTDYVEVQECSGTETFFKECGIVPTDFEDCRSKNCNNSQQRLPLITCLPVNCSDGALRLAGGSTDREGRVEVCLGGRWGTVRTNNLQLVEFVCSTLGFPTEDSKAVTTFGHGTAPIRSCEIVNSALHCIDIADDDSFELGVVCKTHQDVCNESCALEGVIGLLVVVLIGLVIGLTVTCWVLGKCRSQKQQQTEYNISQMQELSTIQRQLKNNPVCSVSMEPHDAYSSSEPIYEQVANGNEQDHSYSILERDKSTDCCSTQLSAIDEEQSYHVVESGECEGVEGASCDSVCSETSNCEVQIDVEQNRQQLGVAV